MPLPGHRSYPSAPQVPADVVEGFEGAAVSIVSDNLNRLHGTRALRPVHGKKGLIGTAVTVKTRAGDNLTIHQAYGLLRPGDVLVVDGGGEVEQALVGEIMMTRARELGVAGFVIDGAVRDVACFAEAEFPCYARGVTHRGPYKTGPGEINVPVCIDGMVVTPGDVILGDEDGVVAFSPDVAAELLPLVQAQTAREAEAISDILAGKPSSYMVAATAPKGTTETGA